MTHLGHLVNRPSHDLSFSASSRLFDLNGEANSVRKKHNRVIIAVDV
jgi:hypothetical protein